MSNEICKKVATSVHLDGVQSRFGLPWLLVPCGSVMVLFPVDSDAVGAHADWETKAKSTLENKRDTIEVWHLVRRWLQVVIIIYYDGVLACNNVI